MAQNITPQSSTKVHPSLSAPPGTKMYDPASCVGPSGELPWLVYTRPARGYEPASSKIVQVPAEVAAVDLAWHPDMEVRLATDEEVARHERAGRVKDAEDGIAPTT